MKTTTVTISAEAKGAITVGGKTYKFVSFAKTKSDAEKFSSAYNKAGYETKIRKAKGQGYALYALWIIIF